MSWNLRCAPPQRVYMAPGLKARVLLTFMWSPSVCPHLSCTFTSSKPPSLLLAEPATHLDLFLCVGTRQTTLNTADRDVRPHGNKHFSVDGADGSIWKLTPGLAFLEQAPAGLKWPGRDHRPPAEAYSHLFLIVSAFQGKKSLHVIQPCLSRVTHQLFSHVSVRTAPLTVSVTFPSGI